MSGAVLGVRQAAERNRPGRRGDCSAERQPPLKLPPSFDSRLRLTSAWRVGVASRRDRHLFGDRWYV